MKLNSAIYLFILEFALIPLIFVGFIIYSYNKVQTTQNTLEKIDAIAQIQSNRLKDVLSQKQSLLDLFISNQSVVESFERFSLRPTSLLRKNLNDALLISAKGTSEIKQIMLANKSGIVVASTDPTLIGSDISQEDYFKKGLKQKDVSTLKKDPLGVTDHYLVGPLAIKENLLGVAILISKSSDIIGLVNDYTGLGQSGETLLVRDDSQGNALFLTSTRFGQGSGLTRTVSKTEMNIAAIHAIAGEERAFENLVDYRKIPVFAATRYLKNIGWGVVVKIDQAEAKAPINKLFNIFLTLFSSTGVLIIILTIPISRSIAAKESEIIKSKEEFTSLTSHQLKTPITSIAWGLDSLLSRNKQSLNYEQRKTLQLIRDRNNDMLELVNGFLDMTKTESAGFFDNKEAVDLVEMSDLVLEELSENIRNKKIKIIKKYGSNNIKLNIGQKSAEIILQNLITNAIKYTPKMGTVEVAIGKTSQLVSISVKDSGYGIPEAEKARIFIKLFRAENIKKIEPSGTGLGLYLVKNLVDKLHGKIWFESKEGVGTTFYVQLPS